MNLLAIDPGSVCGWAIYTDEEGYESGIWKNPPDKADDEDSNVLFNGRRYLTFMQRVRRVIRDKMIDGVCVEHNIMQDRSDYNAMLAGGWLACIEMGIELERGQANRQIFGPFKFTTSSWRSGYWGRYPKLPDSWDKERKRKAHKAKAMQACADEGWSVRTDDEAEALLMLVAFRKKMDPSFAFGRGGDAKAHQMGLAL